MIFSLFGRRFDTASYAVYAAIVAQARQPAFYLQGGVPDTVEGRFDMIVLHASLLFRRLKGEGPKTLESAQQVLDLFFKDMDRSIREMGVSDVSVPRKMKKIGAAYNGRYKVYDTALGADNREAFAAALVRNVYLNEPDPIGLAALVDYGFAAGPVLSSQGSDMLLAGQIVWPSYDAREATV